MSKTDTPRSILITGCSSGIGAAAARIMAARGWRVFATARKADDLERLAQDGHYAVPLDYADAASVEACAAHVLEACEGRLDALFNNGGFGQPGAVEDVSRDVLRQQFEANVFGPQQLTRALIPAMRARGRGRIVQCSSVLGIAAAPWRGAYCASKFAVEALADALRMELRKTGLHVSVIEPGPVASRFNDNAVAAYERNIDMGNSVHARLYAKRIAKLRENRSSRYAVAPEAVVAKLIHAVESPRPKAHYYVTFPTYVTSGLRRTLPRATLDLIMKSN